MKILFIVFNKVGRGTYFRAFELARALANSNHSITLIASANSQKKNITVFFHDNVEIIEIPNIFPKILQSGWDLGNLLFRIQTLKSRHFDIVHGFESRPTVIYPTLRLHRQGIPFFLDWADWFGSGGSIEERPGTIVKRILRPFEDYFETHFRTKAKGTTVICESLKTRAIALGIPEEKICLLPNGFNLPNWKPIPINFARKKIDIDDNFPLIGYLGSFFPSDAKLAARSFNLLRNYNQNIRFIHIGFSNYHIKDLVNDPGSVIETGAIIGQQNVQYYLSSCNLLWLPLRNIQANEGRFPLKFTNYLSCGRPIVATDVGDIPKFIQKAKVGIVTKDNPEELKEASIHLLENIDIQKQYGKNAINLSNKPSESWASRAEQLISLYKEV